MKKSKRLVLAAAIGLVATGGFYFYLMHEPPRAESAIPTQTVLVVAQPIAPNSVITAEQVVVQSRPAMFVPEGSLLDAKEAVGKVAKVAMVPGETVIENKLLTPGAEIPLPFTLAPGKRAITVAVDEVVGVAGFLMPGTLVDVISTLDVDGLPTTNVILQKIQVLAIAQDAAKKDNPQAKVVSSATLAVAPEEAEKLVLAADKGRIRLAIRSPKENGTVKTSGVTSRSLSGAKATFAKPQAKNAQATAPVTRIVRQVVTQKVPTYIKEKPASPEPVIMVIHGSAVEMVNR